MVSLLDMSYNSHNDAVGGHLERWSFGVKENELENSMERKDKNKDIASKELGRSFKRSLLGSKARTRLCTGAQRALSPRPSHREDHATGLPSSHLTLGSIFAAQAAGVWEQVEGHRSPLAR